MAPSEYSKDELYTLVEVVLANGSSDPFIRNEMQRLLWSADDFAEGQSLFDEAQALEAKTVAALGSQVGTTATLSTDVQDVHASYMDVITVCRDVVQDASLRRTLDLDASREHHTAFSRWRQQAGRFFAAALDDPDTRQALDDEGIPASFLQPVRDQIDALAHMNATQEHRKEAYQSSSERLQQVRSDLRDWYRRFRNRARRALRNHPQKLEALNITAETNA